MLNKLIATQVFAASLCAAVPAFALPQTPGLVYSDATLTIESRCKGCPARATKTVPVNDATPFAHLTTFPGFRPFVITQSTQPNAFVSTSIAGNGEVGVGVSGVVGPNLEQWAEATYERTISNPGSTDSPGQRVHIVIPEIRILTSHSEGAVDHPARGVWRAEAMIEVFWFTKDQDGSILDTGNPLSLSVIVDRTNIRSSPSSIATTMSGQLEAFASGQTGVGGQIHDVFYENQVPGTYDYDAIGHTFDRIETDVALSSDLGLNFANVPAFGSLEVAYSMRVGYMSNNFDGDDRTSAFEVMIGDPFEIGGSGASFSVGEAAAVPEPGTWLLMACGLVTLLGARRRGRRIPLAAGVMLLPLGAFAQPNIGNVPILVRLDTDVSVSAHSQIGAGTQTFDQPPKAVRSASDLAKVEAFVRPPEPGWFGFDRGTPKLQSGPFASALMFGARSGGVGVSGSLDTDPALGFGTLASTVFLFGSNKNAGSTGTVYLRYNIPQIEIASVGNRYDGDVGEVRGVLDIRRFDANNRLLGEERLFDYRLRYNYEEPPTTQAIRTWTPSPDLLEDSGGLIDLELDCIFASCVYGRRVDPFRVTFAFEDFPAGGYIDYTYRMETSIVVGLEGGGHALYGDPFEFDGGNGLPLLEFMSAPVPEPQVWLLMLAGLAGLRLTPLRGVKAVPRALPAT
jgi:hypothetical protein